MPHKHTLSLRAAIFICMNIIIGAGVFINSVILPQKAGLLGSFSYLVIGLLLLPLIITIAELIRLHPSGGFYVFSAKEIHPLAGCLAAWSYAVAKMCSVSVLIHSATLFAQRSIPVLATIEPLWIDAIVLFWFGWLNTLGTRTGSVIQYMFLILKITALAIVIFAGFSLIGSHPLSIQPTDMIGFGATLPLVLFATVGFESVCAISAHIKNARKNAPRAIFFSYGFVILLYTLYQLALYIGIGPDVRYLDSYTDAFPTLIAQSLPYHALWAYRLINLVYFCIVAAALGGSYGILFTNTWNIYHIARHGNDPLAHILKQKNKHGVPLYCSILQLLMIMVGIVIASKNQVSTQVLSAFGCSLTYFISTCALIAARLKKDRKHPVELSWAVPMLAFGSCLFLLSTSVSLFMNIGPFPLVVFTIIMLTGFLWFASSYKKQIKII